MSEVSRDREDEEADIIAEVSSVVLGVDHHLPHSVVLSSGLGDTQVVGAQSHHVQGQSRPFREKLQTMVS